MNYIGKKQKNIFNEFAVTLTLNPYFVSMYEYTEQYDILLPEIVSSISLFPTQIKKVNITFELTKANNIHVHLAVKTGFDLKLDVARTLMDLVFSRNNIYGHNKTKPIYNSFGWTDYCNKGEYLQEQHKYAFEDDMVIWDEIDEEYYLNPTFYNT